MFIDKNTNHHVTNVIHHELSFERWEAVLVTRRSHVVNPERDSDRSKTSTRKYVRYKRANDYTTNNVRAKEKIWETKSFWYVDHSKQEENIHEKMNEGYIQMLNKKNIQASTDTWFNRPNPPSSSYSEHWRVLCRSPQYTPILPPKPLRGVLSFIFTNLLFPRVAKEKTQQ